MASETVDPTTPEAKLAEYRSLHGAGSPNAEAYYHLHGTAIDSAVMAEAARSADGTPESDARILEAVLRQEKRHGRGMMTATLHHQHRDALLRAEKTLEAASVANARGVLQTEAQALPTPELTRYEELVRSNPYLAQHYFRANQRNIAEQTEAREARLRQQGHKDPNNVINLANRAPATLSTEAVAALERRKGLRRQYTNILGAHGAAAAGIFASQNRFDPWESDEPPKGAA